MNEDGGGSHEFVIVRVDAGRDKIAVLKVVREVSGFNLAEARFLVENTPREIPRMLRKLEAEALRKRLEDAGGVVQIK